ncbi:MAG: hypothetical protein RLZZ532_616 [Cyanobacteriota bacterium]|jgi:hypothetical protein
MENIHGEFIPMGPRFSSGGLKTRSFSSSQTYVITEEFSEISLLLYRAKYLVTLLGKGINLLIEDRVF